MTFENFFLENTNNLNTSFLCSSDQNVHNFFISKNYKLKNKSTNKISLITWNLHRLKDPQTLPDLIQLSNQSDILMLQEAIHSTSWEATLLNQFPDWHWSFSKSYCPSEGHANGVITSSRFPLNQSKTLVSPGREPFLNSPKVSNYSVIQINQNQILLINTHALNFNFGKDFENQIDSIITKIKYHNGPVIWAGDFNTWNDSRLNFLYSRTISIDLKPIEPQIDNRNLKLDHIFTRGFKFSNATIVNSINSSDHKPIRVDLVFE